MSLRAEILKLINGHYKENAYTGMFSRKDFVLIKENIEKYPWAKQAFKKIKQDADYWAAKTDEELYNFIPPENPRAYAPCYSFGCPICGTGKVARTSVALATSLETPNRWQCVTCSRWWGPGEEIEYKGKGFKITDDGSGWTIPEGLPGEGHRCYFVAAWRTHQLYTLLGSDRAKQKTIKGAYQPKSAIGALATLYAITRDTRYAHKALLILNRVAQLYPTYDGVVDVGRSSYMPHISWTTAGEEEIVDASCYAYNIVFDYLHRDKELVEFFKKKGQEDLDNDGKITHEDIRRNIAINLFGYMYEWLLRTRRYTNNDWTVGHAGQIALIGRTLENPDIVYEALEGEKGFRDLMSKLCYNDGRFYYNSLSYHFGKPVYFVGNPVYFDRVLFAVDGYCDGKRFKSPVDLFHDKTLIFKRMVDYAYGIICNGRIPGIGDQVIPREKIDPYTEGSKILPLATLILHYPYLAEGIENKDTFMEKLVNSLSKAQPRRVVELILQIPEIEKVVKGTRFQPQRSRLFTDTGLAILRTEHKGIDQVHAILNYGIDGPAHSHYDQLALNIIAYGYELTINKGYPFTWSPNSKVKSWTRNTAAQNTVRIDGQNQTAYGLDVSIKEHAGELHAYQDNELVAVVDGSNEAVYPGLASLYRRAIFLIKDPEHPFVIDIFNVAGGNTRDYQFHAQSDIEGKNFKIKFEDKAELKQVKKAPRYIDSRFMYDIKVADTQGGFTAHWWIGDEDNTGLILHMLGDDKVRRTIITAKGQGEGSDKPIPCDPHLIVREEGKNSTQFVSVIFPYHGLMPKYNIEKLRPLNCKVTDKIVALYITVGRDGRRYLVFHNLDSNREYSFSRGNHRYIFSGTCGVILEEEQLKAISLCNARFLGRDDTIFHSEPIKEGKVVKVDGKQKSIIVEDINLPSIVPCLLRWSNKPWVYRVTKIEEVNSEAKMYLDTFSFVDRGRDQLIEEGDKVYLINNVYGYRSSVGDWKIKSNVGITKK